MKPMKFILGLLCLAVLTTAPAFAGERGTAEEAKAMAEKAAALIRTEGPEKALPKIQDKNGGFVDRDLYVVVQDDKLNIKAHPLKPILVGKNTLDMKDSTGTPYMKDMENMKEDGWVDYKFPDPISGKLKNKSAYIIHVGNLEVVCGYYKD